MNLKRQSWSKKDYQEYQEYLRSMAESSYKEFSMKLTPTKYEILGIRVPLQRKIARELHKGNYQEFLNESLDTSFEEVNIVGFLIASLKEEERKKYLDSFLLKIDNWAICDGFCSTLKIQDNEKEMYFEKIKKYLQSEHIFTVRVGLVLLLNYYVEEKYIFKILSLVDSVHSEEYYINMAKAWLVAECFIKERSSTWPYIKKNSLNAFTQNKTICKIRDSYRVSNEDKREIVKYRK